MLSFKEIEKIEEELKCLEEEIKKKERDVYLENNKIYKPHPVIYHMADIHITNKKERYEEYLQIFEKIHK